jgi:deazaflavin-dependent oxidoreductase (nitroreductase family)
MHDVAFKFMNGAHRVLRTLSGGRFGNAFMNMPVLELTTTGRKSGQPRATMLTAPLVEGDRMVIIASRGGDDRHPAWYLNLRDNPDVEVSVQGGPTRSMRARIVEGEERESLWQRVTSKHDNYAGYQKKTDREIPVVMLEPIG